MTEERLSPEEPPNRAVQIVQALITLEFPKDKRKIHSWLEKIKFLQNILSQMWLEDRSGQLMIQCLNVIYNSIALNSTQISPAVWSVLDLVHESKIAEFVEGILSDNNNNHNSKVEHALTAIVDGLCQFGSQVPRLQDWALTIVNRLEARKNYTVLNAVADNVIVRLVTCLFLPAFRNLVYPVFKQFLFPVVTPNVFCKIIDKVPEVISVLEADVDNEETMACLSDFGALIDLLVSRFSKFPYEGNLNSLRLALKRCPKGDFDSESLILWDPDQNMGTSNWSVSPTRPTYTEWDITKVPRSPYKGLVNQGNTCFMNSVLQVLYMTTKFRHDLLEKQVDETERAATDLQQLFAMMRESDRPVLTPSNVLDSTLPPTFRRGHQQDSSEYLIYLLDSLHENESKIIRRKRQNKSEKLSSEKKRDGNGDSEEGAVSLSPTHECENTIVERLFGGESTSTTLCSVCEKEFPKNDSFRDLPLAFPDHNKFWDLQELVDICLRPEELSKDNMYECSSCGMKRNATRTQTITKAPLHLIITLKLFRFDPVRKQRLKLHGKLKNAKTIELPVYESSQLPPIFVMYDLKGVVLHAGSSLDGGHYFASAVDHTTQWYIFNDSVVSATKSGWNTGSGTPYVLLLRKSDLADPVTKPLQTNLQALVNRDNQRYIAERRYARQAAASIRRSDDDYEDDNNGSFHGPGPSLVC